MLRLFGKCLFHELIGDDYAEAKKVKRIILCSGKVYFDLLDYQQKNNRTDTAILRLEQLYPFPMTQLNAQMEKYNQAELVWVQEEPRNMGGWFYIWNLLGNKISKKVSRYRVLTRPGRKCDL